MVCIFFFLWITTMGNIREVRWIDSNGWRGEITSFFFRFDHSLWIFMDGSLEKRLFGTGVFYLPSRVGPDVCPNGSAKDWKVQMHPRGQFTLLDIFKVMYPAEFSRVRFPIRLDLPRQFCPWQYCQTPYRCHRGWRPRALDTWHLDGKL